MGSPHKPDEDEIKSICIGATCSLLLCPITFPLISQNISENAFFADVFGCLLTLLLTVIIAFGSHIVLKSRYTRDRNSNLRRHRSFFSQIFSISSHAHLNHQEKKDSNNNSIYVDENNNVNHNSYRRKIDPKYFKPKFIYHELMTFWDTTYTVVTWGSFYVIGGTIVVTERLASKIKTKCSREHQQNPRESGGHNSNRSSGRRESTFTSASGTSETNSSIKSPLRRVSSWTKRSFNSAKKKFTKFANSAATPQLTAECPSTSSTST